jgi:hypothetical protein
MNLEALRDVPDLSRILHSKKVDIPSQQVVKITTEGLFERQIVIIRNVGRDTVYLGDVNVSPETGFPLFVNEVIVLPTKKDIFAYSKKSGELRVLEG